MATPDVTRLEGVLPGVLRSYKVETIGTTDVDVGGAVVECATAGNLVVTTLDGDDVTLTGAAIGDTVKVAGIPVLIQTVKGTSTVTSVRVGKI